MRPSDAAVVYAATPAGLFRSTNSGASWTNTNSGAGFRAVRFRGADTIVAAGDNGVVISTDAGATWADISAGLDGTPVACIEFADRGGSVLIAGTSGSACWLWTFSTGTADRAAPAPRAAPVVSIVRGVLRLPASGVEREASCFLVDASGRRVLALRPGPNDVSRLAPGVYFVLRTSSSDAEAPCVSRVVIAD